MDLCLTDPGRDFDLTVWASVRAMISVWVGHLAIEDALSSDEVALDGSAEFARSFPRWIGVPSRVRELEDALNLSSLAALGDRGDPRRN